MLHFWEINFGIRIRQNIGQISSGKRKKKRYVSFCHYEGGSLNRISRIPEKYKSTLKFFNIYLDRNDFKQSIN